MRETDVGKCAGEWKVWKKHAPRMRLDEILCGTGETKVRAWKSQKHYPGLQFWRSAGGFAQFGWFAETICMRRLLEPPVRPLYCQKAIFGADGKWENLNLATRWDDGQAGRYFFLFPFLFAPFLFGSRILLQFLFVFDMLRRRRAGWVGGERKKGIDRHLTSAFCYNIFSLFKFEVYFVYCI